MKRGILTRSAAVLLWAGVVFTSPPAARAQEGPTPSEAGPTREAEAMTARGYLGSQGETTPRFMLGYRAFQLEFARDFGNEPGIGDRLGGLLALKARLDTRWGDAALYQWIERGLALYAQFQASTRMQKRGFDFKLETDDVAEGKFGVQMSRPLGTGGTTE